MGASTATYRLVGAAWTRRGTRTQMSSEVYRALGEADEAQLVSALRDEACILVGSGTLAEPAFVYWTDPGLGRWAHHLPHEHRQYQLFYDRVGVSESPTPDQAAALLRRISRDLGAAQVAEKDQAVVHRCWELLDAHLRSDEHRAKADSALKRIGMVRSVVDSRDRLEEPQMLLFLDGRRQAERIELIRDNLVRRDRTKWRALAAAGTRSAEDVIEIFVDPDLPSRPSDVIKRLVEERTPAIRRLVETYRDEELAYDVERLATVSYLVVPDLAIDFITRFDHKVQSTTFDVADAVYLPADDELMVRADAPSRHLARELARCIEPQGDVSAIAPSLHEILSAPTLEAATEVLDDYGVRDLHESTWEHVATQASAEDLDDHEPATEADHGSETESGNETETETTPPSTDNEIGEGSGGGGAASSDGFRWQRARASSKRTSASRHGGGQPRTHMASYVSFDEEDRGDFEQQGDDALVGTRIDEAGVGRVVAYERSCGREPDVRPHNNPGFDVVSRDPSGNVLRRIEIKSIGGPWTGFGVWMSATQMDSNRSSDDDYWLYVVEHAEDDDAFRIHRIQNPASKATKFGFDDGWQALREPEVDRDEAGKPLIGSTRRLLGWADS